MIRASGSQASSLRRRVVCRSFAGKRVRKHSPTPTATSSTISCSCASSAPAARRGLSSCATSGPCSANKLSPAEWRVRTEAALARLADGTHLRENRGRYRTSEEGAQVVASFLGEKEARARAWSEQRDLWLVAKALGVDATKPSLRKALTRPEGLSALIVQQAFGLSLREALSPSKLRTALALVAQERAAENGKAPRKTGALSTEASRKLAAQLLQSRARFFHRRPPHCGAQPPSKWAPRAPRSRCCGSGFCAGSPRRTRSPAAKSRRRRGRIARFGKGPPAPWSGAIFRRCAHRGTPPRRGLARQPQGVYLSGLEGDSRRRTLSGVSPRSSSRACWPKPIGRASSCSPTPISRTARNIKELEESAILYKNTVCHFVRVED